MIDTNYQLMDRASKLFAVRDFFDETQRYLANNANIEIRRRIVKEMVEDIENAKILDFGCGDGSIGLQFVGTSNSVTLVDISQKMLDVARNQTPSSSQARVEYVNDDLAHYESSSKYDLVLCLGVLAHVDAVEGTVRKIAELLKNDGRCVLQITDADRMLGKLSEAYCDVRNRLGRGYPRRMNRIGSRELRSLAAHSGMRYLAERRYASLLPGMGRLPIQCREKYQLFTLNEPSLSRYGSEAILLFSKTA